MKLGILYAVCGVLCWVISIAAIVGLFLFPEAEPSVAPVIGRAALSFFIGLWALPKGINSVREARAERSIKQN